MAPKPIQVPRNVHRVGIHVQAAVVLRDANDSNGPFLHVATDAASKRKAGGDEVQIFQREGHLLAAASTHNV